VGHAGVLMRALREREALDYAGFRQRVLAHAARGDRLVSAFGGPDASAPPNRPALHAVFLERDRGLVHFTGRHREGETYHSLTPELPAMHCFEREIHERWGLRVIDHPWLKPIRFGGEHQRTMGAYPFYSLEGKEVHEVGVGPIHAGVIEPGHFRFMCYGETVHHLEIQLGYQHRGAEELVRTAAPRARSALVESVAGDTAVGYTLAYCRAWEALCELAVPPEVEVVRGVALELERIAMHLAGLSGLATDIAFLPGSSTYGRLRTSLINLSMRLCGSRFGRSWFRPGELRFAFGAAHKDDVRTTLAQVRADLVSIDTLFRKSRSVRHRLRTTGTVTTALARELGVVGMAGRASGLACDLRAELRGGAYGAQPIELVVEPDGDCWSRGVLRIREIEHSIAWILRAVDGLPAVEAEPRRARLEPRPDTGVVSLEEGWRGEVLHYVETDAQGHVSQVKLQDPSLRNWFALAQAVRTNAIYDFPICNKSFDLSYCGNDL